MYVDTNSGQRGAASRCSRSHFRRIFFKAQASPVLEILDRHQRVQRDLNSIETCHSQSPTAWCLRCGIGACQHPGSSHGLSENMSLFPFMQNHMGKRSRITVPTPLHRKLDWHPSDNIRFDLVDGVLSLRLLAVPKSNVQLDQAAQQHAADRDIEVDYLSEFLLP